MNNILSDSVKKSLKTKRLSNWIGWSSHFCGFLPILLGLVIAHSSMQAVGEEENLNSPDGTPQAIPSVHLVEVPIKGVVNDVMVVLVSRAVDRAIDEKASHLLLRMDTPGGSVASLKEIIRHLDRASRNGVRTVTYVVDWAGSAGAVMSVACDEIYLRSNATMGAAAPVSYGTGGAEALGEKYVSFFRTTAKAWAEKKGYPGNLVVAMVDKDMEVVECEVLVEAEKERSFQKKYLSRQEVDDRIREIKGQDRIVNNYLRVGRVIIAKGKLLTLTGPECVKLGLGQSLIETDEQLHQALGLTNPVIVRLQTTWSEDLVGFLTSPGVASLLLLIGVVGLWTEFQSPGLGVPGIVGTLALILLFGSSHLMGLADVMDVLIFFMGFVFLLVEIFVLPGFGIPGLLGLLMIFAGGVLSMQRFTVPTEPWQVEILKTNLFWVGSSLMAGFFLIVLSFRFLGESALFRKVVLQQEIGSAGGSIAVDSSRSRWIGRTGRADSMLRPIGTAVIDEEFLEVTTQGEFVDAGTPVTVISVGGNRIVVKEEKEER
ncbi:MAG: NfeD family protein [Planctomycetota bacterium]|jgi:membrane-bound serine protease (ClpP class)|nr:NfeD family protein [Planctomycetota bacterium]